MNEKVSIRVLLVEDDESDVIFFERALRSLRARVDLQIARDGEEAIQALTPQEGRPLPDQVLLDLKLPRRSGLEVLTWIRSTPALRNLPVTILTSSGEPSDLRRIRELGIEEYIVKPVSYRGLLEVVGALCSKWELLKART
jgi:CheY-like chemotaxis protein